MSRLLLVSVLLAAAACGSSDAAGPRDEPHGEPVVLTFDWPRKGSVQVTEYSFREGFDTEKAYVVRWEPIEGSSDVGLERAQMRFTKVSGMDASDPRVRPSIEQMEPLLPLIPTLRVDEEGQAVGFLGWDALARATHELMASQMQPAEREAAAAALDDPMAQQVVQVEASRFWSTWVGTWIGLEIAPGGTVELQRKLPLFGASVQATLRYHCVERTDHRGVDCVRLTREVDFDPDALQQAAAAWIAATGENPLGAVADYRVRRTDHLEGVFEVATLRPHQVRNRIETEYTSPMAGKQVQREELSYVFDWPDLRPAKR